MTVLERRAVDSQLELAVSTVESHRLLLEKKIDEPGCAWHLTGFRFLPLLRGKSRARWGWTVAQEGGPRSKHPNEN